MKMMRKTDSTKDLRKLGDIEAIWEVVMRFLMQNHHIEYIKFPNDPTKNNIMLAQFDNLHSDNYQDMTEATSANKF